MSFTIGRYSKPPTVYKGRIAIKNNAYTKTTMNPVAYTNRSTARSRARGVALYKPIPKPAPGAFVRQLKALVAGKKRDAADVTRTTAAQTATTISCLSSSTDFATAASGTGLFDMDGDEALINSVRIMQTYTNACFEDLTPVGLFDCYIRTLIVYFKKPLLVASAAGTLPPVTEVLVSDAVNSLIVPDTQNSGRFVIMYDQIDNMGQNTVAVAASGADARLNGRTRCIRDFTVKIDKKCHFKSPGVSGTPSGHYDSDVSPGQVDAGLLVMYVLINGVGGTLTCSNITRLNYTG